MKHRSVASSLQSQLTTPIRAPSRLMLNSSSTAIQTNWWSGIGQTLYLWRVTLQLLKCSYSKPRCSSKSRWSNRMAMAHGGVVDLLRASSSIKECSSSHKIVREARKCQRDPPQHLASTQHLVSRTSFREWRPRCNRGREQAKEGIILITIPQWMTQSRRI